MNEIIIFVLLGFILMQEFFNRKERQKLSETLIAKSLTEIRDIELTRKQKPVKEDKPSEFILESELDDKDFDKKIKEINEQ